MTALTITIPGVARGKGRPRFGNGRTYTDTATEKAETWIRHCAIEQVGARMLEGPLAIDMRVDVMVPASWSRRKREDAIAGRLQPTGKPDCDNTLKLACDALNKILWRDDAQIVHAVFAKRYAEAPQTVLTVRAA